MVARVWREGGEWGVILPLKFFLVWTIFKVLLGSVTVLLLSYVLVFWPQGMWDLAP